MTAIQSWRDAFQANYSTYNDHSDVGPDVLSAALTEFIREGIIPDYYDQRRLERTVPYTTWWGEWIGEQTVQEFIIKNFKWEWYNNCVTWPKAKLLLLHAGMEANRSQQIELIAWLDALDLIWERILADLPDGSQAGLGHLRQLARTFQNWTPGQPMPDISPYINRDAAFPWDWPVGMQSK